MHALSIFYARVLAVFAFVCVLGSPPVSRADDTPVVDSAHSASRSEPYAPWLAASYVLAPLVAVSTVAATSALIDDEYDDTSGESYAIGITLGFLTPAVMHWTQGEGALGTRALFGFPGVTLGAGLLGGLAGSAFGSATEPEGEEASTTLLLFTLGGGLLGAGIGAISWAVFDIKAAYRRDAQHAKRNAGSIAFAAVPLPSGGAMGFVHGSF